MTPSTFSIAAFDPANGDLGIAVASKFLAVGSVVPWARAGVGAVATQSFANTSYGPRGLRLLRRGLTPRQAGQFLVARDRHAPQRQFGLVDARGRSHTFTGGACFEWAGGATGRNYAAQGNILAGPAVVENLARTFVESRGDLAARLVAALVAGQAAGGDRRGQEGAALYVVRAKGGYGGLNDRYIDLRVDDHPRPVDELARLLELHRMYLDKPRPADRLPIDAALARELQALLARGGHPLPPSGEWDEASRRALRELCGVENLEERFYEGPWIDRVALDFLRRKFPA